jgi:hypothetical protein
MPPVGINGPSSVSGIRVSPPVCASVIYAMCDLLQGSVVHVVFAYLGAT